MHCARNTLALHSTPVGPSPGPSPVGRGVVCEVTPTGLLARVVMSSFSHSGEFYLSQSAQSSRSFLAHVSIPQNAFGIQISQNILAIFNTNKGQRKAYILLIGVSR